MDDFGDAGMKSVGGRAEGGEDSLRGQGEEKGGDGDNNDGLPAAMTKEGEEKKHEDGDGVGVNSAAREREKEGGGKEAGEEPKPDLLTSRTGARRVGEGEEVNGEEGGGEEEIAHELGLDGKPGRMRKAEGPKGATGTEQGTATGEADEVEDGLEPAKGADEGGGNEERFEEELAPMGVGLEERKEEEEGENREKGQPKYAGSEEGAERIGGPKNGESGIERKKRKEEEAFVGETGLAERPRVFVKT